MTAQTEQVVEMATEIKALRDALEHQRVLFEEASQRYYRVLDEKKGLAKELEALRTNDDNVMRDYKKTIWGLYNTIDNQKVKIEKLTEQNESLISYNAGLIYHSMRAKG